jgi:error-prone DNA polymerase
MAPLRALLGRRISPLTSREVSRAPQGKSVTVVGLIIVRQRPPTAKGTAFATLEDEHGLVDLILQKPVHEKYWKTFRTYSFLSVTGRVQRDGQMVNLIVQRLEPLVFGPSSPVESGHLRTQSHDFR